MSRFSRKITLLSPGNPENRHSPPQPPTGSFEERYATEIFDELIQSIKPTVLLPYWKEKKIQKLIKMLTKLYYEESNNGTKQVLSRHRKIGAWSFQYFMNTTLPIYRPDLEWYVESVLTMLRDEFDLKNIYNIYERFMAEKEQKYDDETEKAKILKVKCVDSVIRYNNNIKNPLTYKIPLENCDAFDPLSEADIRNAWMAQFIALIIDVLPYTLMRISENENVYTRWFGLSWYSQVDKMFPKTLDKIPDDNANASAYSAQSQYTRIKFTDDFYNSFKWPTPAKDTFGLKKLPPSATPPLTPAESTPESVPENVQDSLPETLALSSFVASPIPSVHNSVSNVDYSTGSSPTIHTQGTASTMLASPGKGFPSPSQSIVSSMWDQVLTPSASVKQQMNMLGGCGCGMQSGGVARRRSVQRKKSMRRKSSLRKKTSRRKRTASRRRRTTGIASGRKHSSCGKFVLGKTYSGYYSRPTGEKVPITAKVIECTKQGPVVKPTRGPAFHLYKYRGKWVYGSGAYPIVLRD